MPLVLVGTPIGNLGDLSSRAVDALRSADAICCEDTRRTGRLLQKILQEQKLVALPINVVNKPGGGGAVGLAYLSQHPGDGHYLLVNSMTLFTNHLTGRTPLSYTDFTPIADGRLVRELTDAFCAYLRIPDRTRGPRR